MEFEVNNSESAAARPSSVWDTVRWLLKPLASLRLTVIFFAFAIFLVFVGTLAQIDYGLYTVLHKYFRAPVAWIPLQLFVQFGQIFLGVPKSWNVAGEFPFPGGWMIGGLLLANLLAAHFVRFKLSWKRSGILLIHSGLVVMMVGEFVTGIFAVESRLTMQERESVNFVEESNAIELAVVDSSGSDFDSVVSIPAAVLQRGGTIQSEWLPFDIEVQRYFVNSAMQVASTSTKNPATEGFGLDWIAIAQPEVSGTSSKGEDVPSAYVRIKEKNTGKPIETLLVSGWLTYRFDLPPRPQQVTLKGKTYDLYLRHKHIYKPYAMELLEVRHDVYPGTDIPKNYSSRVWFTVPSEGEAREVLISMNSPFRHDGDTLYQSGILAGGRGTILQVVRNPAWEMPYVSCGMVSGGMIFHFLVHLVGFLRRRTAA